MFLRSYILNRSLFIRYGERVTNLLGINAVSQGTVLEPILYPLYTYNHPMSNIVVIGTFSQDTAILASASNAISASRELQLSLNEISQWLNE